MSEENEKKPKTDKFVEVELKDNEEDESGSTFCFECVKCEQMALAVNGSLFLRNPYDMMSPHKSYDVDYLFCPECEIVENMKDKDFDKKVVVCESEEELQKRAIYLKTQEPIAQTKIAQDIFKLS